ncbi:hypothetical protein H0X09_00380 [Candidatus Saccharibacteria bacterium]|nr:hypothetical protein [Candidatus Saccharibacteria bacterium]
MMFAVLTLVAQQAPDVGPVLNFPGSEWVINILNVLLGIIAFALIAIFFVGLFKLIGSLGGKREGATSAAGIQMIASVVGLLAVFAGGAFLNRWVDFIG